jgi:lipoxygenase/linoleate 9S-lipoxygenase
MQPHFRFTLNINSQARQSLVNGGGIIENTFSSRAYAMRLSAVAYRDSWRFSSQALPADLKER